MTTFRQGTDLPSIQVCDVDPTIGLGIPGGTPNLLLIRTDVPSLYYYSGPLDTDWVRLGNGIVSVPTGFANALAFFGAAPPLAAPITGGSASLYVDPATKNVYLGGDQGVTQLFINQAGPDNGSNSGIQQASLVANRAQYRGSQYGNNTGVPGVSSFKSRGVTIGSKVAVQVGDVIFRATAVGVCGDNNSIPLSGLISINVDVVAANFLGTSFEVQLVPPTGPINGRKQAFRVEGNGIVHVREGVDKMAGLAVLDLAGQAVINNVYVTATTKFLLTAQDGGAVPTGNMYQSARVAGASFTIKSTAGAADVGVQVYYQLYEPTIP